MTGIKDKVRKYLFEIFLIAPALIYLLGFLILVIIGLVKMSLTIVNDQYQEVFPRLDNWVFVFNSKDFSDAFVNTLGFVLVGTPLELIVGMILSLLIYKSFKGRNFIQSIFTLPLAIPALVTAVILFILFDFPGGHINNLITGKHTFFPMLVQEPVNFRSNPVFALGISLIGKVWRDMPISMLILLAGLNSLDHEQQEAAVTMGASSWQRFLWVTVPLLLPSISSVLILRSIEVWKEFIFPFVLAGRYPLLGTLIESLYHNWQKPEQASVVALFLLVCVVVSTLVLFWVLKVFRKQIVRFVV
jgi:ABC-type sugar transport system permease subunit